MTDGPAHPMQAAQRLARPELPRRFYKSAAVAPHETGYALTLDGKVARTPARKPLAVRSRAIAEAVAAEWAAQGERIDPASMPLTRIVNAAIDRVSGDSEAVRGEIVRYAGSDLVCYRAEGPRSLVEAENAAWSPLTAWAREALGVRLNLAEGVMAVAQPPATQAAVAGAIAALDPLGLAALHVATTLTGSAIIALAVLKARLSADEAWSAAHVSEDWQMAQWGRDEMALARRAERWKEMQAAAFVLAAYGNRASVP